MSNLREKSEEELKERLKGKRQAVAEPKARRCKKLRSDGHCDDHPLDRCVNVPLHLCYYVLEEG